MRKSSSIVGVLIAWVAVYALFACFKESFRSLDTVELLFRQSIIIGIGAIGMTYVVMSAGIDLSAGSQIALTTVAAALTLNATHDPILTIAACLLTGVLCGLLNGVLTSKLRAGPFIVTLGSMLAVRGLAKGLANEKPVYVSDQTWLSNLTAALDPGQRWLLIPIGGWVWVILLALMAWALRYTVFGRNVVAIGSNESAAKLCGVAIDRVKIATYAMAGFFFGVAGLMMFSRTRAGDPTISVGDELRMIAAVVIGGASLTGGEGSVWGAAIGVLIMTTISMGCAQMAIPNWVQEIVTGAIILTAVALDRRRAAKAQGT